MEPFCPPAEPSCPHTPAMDLGERLEAAREARGYRSLSAFARAIGVAASSLHEIKQGATPRPDRLELICGHLGIDRAVMLYGSDEQFDAALKGASEGFPARTFRLDSAIEADSTATGPAAWKHFPSDRMARPAHALDEGRGMRSRTGSESEESARVVELAGVPFGVDLYEVASGAMMIMVDGVPIDALHPHEILLIDPALEPLEGDLVVAKLEAEPPAKRRADIKLWRFHKHGRIEMLVPLDEEPERSQKLADGWEIVGVVSERRRLR